MAMKETERSLRAYFLMCSVVGIAIGLSDLTWIHRLAGRPVGEQLAQHLPAITNAACGVAAAVAGINLRTALLTGARWIKTMLVISGAMIFVNGAIATWALAPRHVASDIFTSVLGLAITIYLHRNVTRLAAEAAARAGLAPPPPAARVVDEASSR